jgi:hypothetical protein
MGHCEGVLELLRVVQVAGAAKMIDGGGRSPVVRELT